MNKCKFDGKNLIMCDNISGTIRGTNGNVLGLTTMEVANLTNYEEYTKGIIYKYGNGKNDAVVIEFCPACGENINSKTKEN